MILLVLIIVLPFFVYGRPKDKRVYCVSHDHEYISNSTTRRGNPHTYLFKVEAKERLHEEKCFEIEVCHSKTKDAADKCSKEFLSLTQSQGLLCVLRFVGSVFLAGRIEVKDDENWVKDQIVEFEKNKDGCGWEKETETEGEVESNNQHNDSETSTVEVGDSQEGDNNEGSVQHLVEDGEGVEKDDSTTTTIEDRSNTDSNQNVDGDFVGDQPEEGDESQKDNQQTNIKNEETNEEQTNQDEDGTITQPEEETKIQNQDGEDGEEINNINNNDNKEEINEANEDPQEKITDEEQNIISETDNPLDKQTQNEEDLQNQDQVIDDNTETEIPLKEQIQNEEEKDKAEHDSHFNDEDPTIIPEQSEEMTLQNEDSQSNEQNLENQSEHEKGETISKELVVIEEIIEQEEDHQELVINSTEKVNNATSIVNESSQTEDEQQGPFINETEDEVTTKPKEEEKEEDDEVIETGSPKQNQTQDKNPVPSLDGKRKLFMSISAAILSFVLIFVPSGTVVGIIILILIFIVFIVLSYRYFNLSRSSSTNNGKEGKEEKNNDLRMDEDPYEKTKRIIKEILDIDIHLHKKNNSNEWKQHIDDIIMVKFFVTHLSSLFPSTPFVLTYGTLTHRTAPSPGHPNILVLYNGRPGKEEGEDKEEDGFSKSILGGSESSPTMFRGVRFHYPSSTSRLISIESEEEMIRRRLRNLLKKTDKSLFKKKITMIPVVFQPEQFQVNLATIDIEEEEEQEEGEIHDHLNLYRKFEEFRNDLLGIRILHEFNVDDEESEEEEEEEVDDNDKKLRKNHLYPNLKLINEESESESEGEESEEEEEGLSEFDLAETRDEMTLKLFFQNTDYLESKEVDIRFARFILQKRKLIFPSAPYLYEYKILGIEDYNNNNNNKEEGKKKKKKKKLRMYFVFGNAVGVWLVVLIRLEGKTEELLKESYGRVGKATESIKGWKKEIKRIGHAVVTLKDLERLMSEEWEKQEDDKK